jgi:hypothetical protein
MAAVKLDDGGALLPLGARIGDPPSLFLLKIGGNDGNNGNLSRKLLILLAYSSSRSSVGRFPIRERREPFQAIGRVTLVCSAKRFPK